jgi:NAD(P)-dependent dehydrogenase (short-subunit alcohol dehydrogenase family)
MSLFDAYGYNGKRALVVGGATGMGAAVAELVKEAGAEVVVMDRAPVSLDGVKSIQVDLAEKASIEAAVDESGGPVHALFSCAGVADGTPGLERINFLGHRHMINRMRAAGMLARGSAIGFISSAAGAAWLANMDKVNRYLDITDFDEAAKYAVDNNMADYLWSKLAICTYVAREAMGLLKDGIRVNAILPGPTDTPLARANADMWLGFASDYRAETGIEPSTPLEQAYALAFLCSDAAAAVTGITMVTDVGYFASGLSGSFPAAAPVAQFLTTSEF